MVETLPQKYKMSTVQLAAYHHYYCQFLYNQPSFHELLQTEMSPPQWGINGALFLQPFHSTSEVTALKGIQSKHSTVISKCCDEKKQCKWVMIMTLAEAHSTDWIENADLFLYATTQVTAS